LLFILIWSNLNIHLFLALWAHFTMEIVQITRNRFQWYVSVFWCGHGFMTIIICVCVYWQQFNSTYSYDVIYIWQVKIDQKQWKWALQLHFHSIVHCDLHASMWWNNLPYIGAVTSKKETGHNLGKNVLRMSL
jgi:hypothetical protein